MVLRKSFYIRWSAGRSPRVHEVNPGRDPSYIIIHVLKILHVVLILHVTCYSMKWHNCISYARGHRVKSGVCAWY